MAPTTPEHALRDAEDRFIATWGQMAGAWGISRTMAEVHALLYVTGESLCTDDIMDRLQISRGNASMSLRALVDWNIISRVTKRGDRKEYFQAEQDVWAMFRAIVRERISREIDPLLASLHEIRDITARAAKELPAKELAAKEMVKDLAAKELASKPGERRDDKTPSVATRLQEHNDRIDSMVEFFDTAASLGQRFVSPSGKGLRLAASILNKLPDVSSVLPGSEARRRGAAS
jgi:DNA-binding transcriptional regulator GbsR (MarR family)